MCVSKLGPEPERPKKKPGAKDQHEPREQQGECPDGVRVDKRKDATHGPKRCRSNPRHEGRPYGSRKLCIIPCLFGTRGLSSELQSLASHPIGVCLGR